MTNYQRGYAFEQLVKKHFEDMGHYCIASRGSHGPADIAVFCLGGYPLPFLIQCKKNGAISEEDWKELYRVSKDVLAMAYLCYKPGRGVDFELIEIGPTYNPPAPTPRVRRSKKPAVPVSE